MTSPTPHGTLVVVNSTGRQTSSVIRYASAVGYKVRAQLRSATTGPKVGTAQELAQLPNVELIEGHLDEPGTIERLFAGECDVAFINTTFWGDEVTIGKSLARAARDAGVKHFVYSALADHTKCYGDRFPHLPYWATKFEIEEYLRSECKDMPSTFVYPGIYNNNFSTFHHLPLWEIEMLGEEEGGGFRWSAPFDEDYKLPFLDTEHDTGPAVIQILKDGAEKWNGARIPLAFELLSPIEIVETFSRALNRPFTYVKRPLEINVKLPEGYQDQVEAIAKVFGQLRADYYPPGMTAPKTARKIWRGWRGLEEYAREVFPVEEANNGRTWMYDDDDDDEDFSDEEYGYGRDYEDMMEMGRKQMVGFSPDRTTVGGEEPPSLIPDSDQIKL